MIIRDYSPVMYSFNNEPIFCDPTSARASMGIYRWRVIGIEKKGLFILFCTRYNKIIVR